MQKYLPQIVDALPQEWRGTTFKNSNLLGREGFAKNLAALLEKTEAANGTITTEDLVEVGNAEDYLRVSSNVSSTLEMALGLAQGLPIAQVFTFSSVTMPILATLLTSKTPVTLYTGKNKFPFTSEQERVIGLLGAKLNTKCGAAPAEASDEVVLALEAGYEATSKVDGLIKGSVLYILNPEKIVPAEILVVRKRTATPMTTPMAESQLKTLAGKGDDKLASLVATDAEKADFHAHLQTLCGTPVNPESNPVVNVAGLAAIKSLWIELISRGGADILMCSTAYGGSSQLADVLTARADSLKKHTFDIQGSASIVPSIQNALNGLEGKKDELKPTTVLFVETPTNPDMKVVDPSKVVEMLQNYGKATGRETVLLIDTTFGPASQVLKKIRDVDEDLTAIVFISMSKSVSRGLTTAGTMVGNHTEKAKSLIAGIRNSAEMFDTIALPDQYYFLCHNHTGVEDRCDRAYKNACACGAALQAAVKEFNGNDMSLAFVTPEQGAAGFTTSTFSFNLPPPEGASGEELAALAQKFVDLVVSGNEGEFKPCVSFGQDNGLVYATVPATSTQGAIKEEHKAKQAVGGVQLVRLSFPPSMDVEKVTGIMKGAVEVIYKK